MQLQIHCGKLEEEITSVKNQLKSTKHQVRQLQQKIKQATDMKAKYEEEVTTLQSELNQAQEMVETTRGELKKNGETRLKEIAKAKKGTTYVGGVAQNVGGVLLIKLLPLPPINLNAIGHKIPGHIYIIGQVIINTRS